MLRKTILFCSLCMMLLLSAALVSAESNIESLFLVGKGLAVSSHDALDFTPAKIAAGVVKAKNRDGAHRVGVFHVGDDKFRLNNIERSEDGWLEARILDGSTEVGMLALTKVDKNGFELWGGKMSLHDESMHLYIVGAKRKAKPKEVRDKVKDYCKHMENDEDCKGNIKERCDETPDSPICKRLFAKHCAGKTDDVRCREHFSEYCKENMEAEMCKSFNKKRMTQYCRDHPRARLCKVKTGVKEATNLADVCKRAPDEVRCEEFCKKHPLKCGKLKPARKRVNIAEYCIDKPTIDVCQTFCRQNPSACGDYALKVRPVCADDPSDSRCDTFCKSHPVLCDEVDKDLYDYCQGKSNDAKCKVFCRFHPGACRTIEVPGVEV